MEIRGAHREPNDRGDTPASFEQPKLLQLREFGLRSDENGDVMVGVFPKCEEILILRELASLLAVTTALDEVE